MCMCMCVYLVGICNRIRAQTTHADTAIQTDTRMPLTSMRSGCKFASVCRVTQCVSLPFATPNAARIGAEFANWP